MSQQVFAIFRSVTPLVEPLSLDEAYLDVTENAWGEALGMNVARAAEAGDPRRDRPDGVGRRRAEQVPREDRLRLAEAGRSDGGCPGAGGEIPAGLPVDASGASVRSPRASLRRTASRSLSTCESPIPACSRPVGSLAEWLQQLAHGIDDRPVVAEHEAKSSGSENTFATDLTDIAEIRRGNREMARHGAAGWKRDLYARTVTIKVRYNDFTTITRSHTEPAAATRTRLSPWRSHCSKNRGRPPAGSAARRQRAQSERDSGILPEGPPRLPFED